MVCFFLRSRDFFHTFPTRREFAAPSPGRAGFLRDGSRKKRASGFPPGRLQKKGKDGFPPVRLRIRRATDRARRPCRPRKTLSCAWDNCRPRKTLSRAWDNCRPRKSFTLRHRGPAAPARIAETTRPAENVATAEARRDLAAEPQRHRGTAETSPKPAETPRNCNQKG